MAGYAYYAQLPMALVRRFGGQHHGCVLLSGRAIAPKIALTLFLFPSLAKCGRGREAALQDARACLRSPLRRTPCIVSDERSFPSPVPR
ncbi:hypothetical protein XocBAI20_18640 [Xanthomonas oryzae pv. oryzicola]|nr:hypothetical protein XocBAI20_18640 [Xanthomonas oryzae pv. oryzicola]OWB29435.1 hypothetical protein XocBAI21_11720 [Xanthomonas oryzae pv. oryzicola]